jgi:predicted TIM-barrel fold metal-dependent hydrolase
MEGNRDVQRFCSSVDFLHPVVTYPINLGSIGNAAEYLDLNSKIYRLYFDVSFSINLWDRTLKKLFEGVYEKKAALIIPYESVAVSLIHQIASEYSELPLIISGINYPQFRSALGIFESHSRTYMEISHFSMFNGVEYLAKTLGPDRLIFGTNWPVFAHRSNVIKLQKAGISDEQKKLIGEENLTVIIGGLP